MFDVCNIDAFCVFDLTAINSIKILLFQNNYNYKLIL